MAKTEQAKLGPIAASISFFKDAWAELKKVHVPRRQEAVQATIVVLLMIVAYAVCLGMIDMLVGRFMQYILTPG